MLSQKLWNLLLSQYSKKQKKLYTSYLPTHREFKNLLLFWYIALSMLCVQGSKRNKDCCNFFTKPPPYPYVQATRQIKP